MRKSEEILFTTHLQSDKLRFTPEAIESSLKEITNNYIPVIDNHDPRSAPLGRIRSGRIVQLDDGEWALIGLIEYFEKDDYISPCDQKKRVRLFVDKEEFCHVRYDGSFGNEDGKILLKELEGLFNETPQLYEKRSTDHVSSLVISFIGGVLTHYAVEFFKNNGREVINKLIKHISLYLSKQSKHTTIIQYVFPVEIENKIIEANILLVNPTKKDLDDVLKKQCIELMESQLKNIEIIEKNLAKITFYFENGKLEMKWAIRADCFPIEFNSKTE